MIPGSVRLYSARLIVRLPIGILTDDPERLSARLLVPLWIGILTDDPWFAHTNGFIRPDASREMVPQDSWYIFTWESQRMKTHKNNAIYDNSPLRHHTSPRLPPSGNTSRTFNHKSAIGSAMLLLHFQMGVLTDDLCFRKNVEPQKNTQMGILTDDPCFHNKVESQNFFRWES